MKAFVSKGTLVAAVFVAAMLVAVFFVGAHRGYDLGYKDGEKRANGWWIDKKSRYYESAEIKKKRIKRQYHII